MENLDFNSGKRTSFGKSSSISCFFVACAIENSQPYLPDCQGCIHAEREEELLVELFQYGGVNKFVLGVVPINPETKKEEFCLLSEVEDINTQKGVFGIRGLIGSAQIEIKDLKIRQKLGISMSF